MGELTITRMAQAQIPTAEGSAIEVMLITRCRITVGQQQHRNQGDRQQCWSSETHVQGVAPCSARTMAISTMANRITRARRAGVTVLYPPMSRAGSQEPAPGLWQTPANQRHFTRR